MTIQELHGLFDTYRHQANLLLQYAKEHNDTKAQAALLRVQHRLHQGPIRALVLGASSAGKSTLINALSGDIVTPEGQHTTSPIPVWIYNRQAKSSPQICLLRNQDNTLQENLCGLYEYIQEYCYTETEAGQSTGQEKFQDLVAATANLSSSPLINHGITLIDTPGSGVSAQDNARAQSIIRDGCEFLIIVAKDFKNQEIKNYFHDLLIPENAPFHSLLGTSDSPESFGDEDLSSASESADSTGWNLSLDDCSELSFDFSLEEEEAPSLNRVFMVVNCIDNTEAKLLDSDTRNQLKTALPDWDPQGHFFVLNARDARYHACQKHAGGYYPYAKYLPKCSKEVWDQAEASYAKEIEELAANAAQARDWAAKQLYYPDAAATMKELCDALCQAADQLCQDPEATAQLLAPIQNDLSIAVHSLEAPILKEYQEAAEATYKAPEIWLKEKQQLEQRLEELNLCLQEFRNTIYSISSYSEKTWPLDKPLKKIYYNDYLLLAESSGSADSYMQEVIQEDHSPEKLTLLIKSRLPKRLDQFCNELADGSLNPEIKHWQDHLTSLFQKLRTYNTLPDCRFVADDDILVCEDNLYTYFEDAKRSGKSALKKADIFSLSDQQKKDFLDYFTEKKAKVDAGGFGRGWAKFWLWPNTSTDKLIPLVKPMLQEGRKVYMTAYRHHFNVAADRQFLCVQELTDKMQKAAAERLTATDQSITNFQAKAKQDRLDQIHGRLTALRALYSMTSDSQK